MIKHKNPLLLVVGLLAFGVVGYWYGTSTTKTIGIDTTDTCLDVKSTGHDDAVWIEGGAFKMGATDGYKDEGPVTTITQKGFWIDKHEVTNAQFARFVEVTGYTTLAERIPDKENYPDIPDEMRIAGSVVFIPPTNSESGRYMQWWQFVPGANWRHPQGPDSNIQGKENHPVVHIAYEDALAYAHWVGRDLPTETQWEYAARGGNDQLRYAWGNEFTPDNRWMANTWQGLFPFANTLADGHFSTAQIGCYPPNDYGLYDMIGNVWEWTRSRYYPQHAPDVTVWGPERAETGFDPNQPGIAVRTIRGGSFLCAENYCQRYRPAARHAQDETLGASHLGFRTVLNE